MRKQRVERQPGEEAVIAVVGHRAGRGPDDCRCYPELGAIELRQVGAGIAKIQREVLEGEPDADIPGSVVRNIVETERGWVRVHDGQVAGGADPEATELARDVHAT